MIDFGLPEEIGHLGRELARFAERELRPRMREFEQAGAWDEAALKALGAFELAGLDLPESWGGAGAGVLAKAVALEELATGDAGGLPGADRIGAAAAAALACPDTSAAREVASACLADEARCWIALDGRAPEWLPGRGAPEWTWVCDGTRLALLATEACEAGRVEAAAFHASGGVGIDLAGAKTAGSWTLDEAAALAVRGRARLWPAAVAVGIARASLDYAVAYAKERVVMGRPVAHHQGNAFAIAEAAAALEAARAAVRAAAHRLDAGADPWSGLWATLAFLDAHEAALAVTDLGVQLLGGHGYIEDHPAEKWFREARALALLYGGRDAAYADAETAVLEAPDPLLP